MISEGAKNVDKTDVARVLAAMANLMSDFGRHDLELQNALSAISERARATPEMGHLQHVDLITQTHEDLAKLLFRLAHSLEGEATDLDTLRQTLTLRSLQDALIDGAPVEDVETGELSLF
ncbi:MAG: hypothetical protein AAGF55_09670 [Pseudomonadota bacterium]